MRISDFTIDNLPDGEHLVVWYNNVNHFNIKTQDFYIIFIIKNLKTKEFKIIYRNIKESPDISLGSIIYNKSVTSKSIGEEFISIIDVPKHDALFTMKRESLDFYKDEEYFSLPEDIPLTIHTYNLLKRSREQRLLEYTDIDGNKILFPSYVIAQYYYYRSSSMSKQVMAHYITNETALKGLYKSYSRDEDGNASIVLKPNACASDGAEIFRFAVDEYANYNFHRVYKDLAKSKREIDADLKELKINPTHNTAALSALFPFYDLAYIRYRGVVLSDDRILALEILAEDSKYPFEKLTIYRQSKKIGANPIKLGSIENTLDSNISGVINDRVPSGIFTPVDIYSEPKEDGRIDLKDKEVTYEILDFEEEVDEIQTTDKVDYETDVSFTESESSGDIDTAQADIETDVFTKPDGWDEKERPGLEAFLSMLGTAQEKAEKKDMVFNYFVNDEQMLPQKPKSSKGRNQWSKSLLVDNTTPRAYSCAFIEYSGKHVCVFDVERDSRVKGLSILIIAMNNNTPISDSLIKNILLDFVQEKGSWLQKISIDRFKKKNINHPGDISKNGIDGWADRLLKSIKDI
ncbi:Tn7-like element transposition protein TnsE [Sulfurimonas sp.]|uniref:Tn7-like element transposition protein TnsE n=1 Tax=Sulfurimonas sp. TaxID=2022749 RepID=UPI0019FC31DB|nr:Tn7-like element transposition protein TnsE [Sulfurimonas sp.]MBE0513932.1 hypothetical protein [Sulfurimonas sp.]